MPYKEKTLYYIIILMCVLTVTGDIFLLYIIQKFKRLKSQIPYTYIFHAAVMDALDMLARIVVSSIVFKVPVPSLLDLDSFVNASATLELSKIAFLVWMTMDWVLATYHPTKSFMLRKYKIVIIISVYVYTICGLGLSFTDTVVIEDPMLAMVLVYYSFLISISVIGVMYSCRRKAYASETFALKVASFNVIVWCATFGLAFLISVLGLNINFYVILLIHIAPYTSTLQVFLLYMWDINYRECVSTFLSCNTEANGDDVRNGEDTLKEQPMRYV